MSIEEIAKKAKAAAPFMAVSGQAEKNAALHAMAEALQKNALYILECNEKDMAGGREKGMTAALLDRLQLTEARIDDMANGLLSVALLSDPVGETIARWVRPNGLEIGMVRVPLGVVGIIYEARPNVTSDAAGLCIKSGNAVILKGGKEAVHSNVAIVRVLSEAGCRAGLPENCIQIVDDTSREAAAAMMKMNGLIDVLIPRGGASLIQSVLQNATVPVIETGTGNCHVYIDSGCDDEMATRILVNSKTTRVGVCNSAESLLVHADKLDRMEKYLGALRQKNVEVRGCSRTKKSCPWVKDATEEDYATEYLDYIISVKVVDSLDEAIAHINQYGTKHSEAIVTNDYFNARKFQSMVDAAAVYVNASTRFTDGYEFGFGAEIGISTQKLHARGPMALKELTTYKYVINGSGQIR
ncbi:MAG: glutamate-5-semialdehyde dehydrogenase [Christensenellales bacterium]